MSNTSYRLSFSTGGLFQIESVKLAEAFLELKDWDIVRNKSVSGNMIQARTMKTSKRVAYEIISRLKTLSVEDLEFLVTCAPQDQRYLLWLAACRLYKFIGDFAVEVLHEKFITLTTSLTYEDFDSFCNQKSEWHPELDELSSTTKKKIRQVLFKILREADLLTSQNTINAALLSSQLKEMIATSNRRDILFFPTLEGTAEG